MRKLVWVGAALVALLVATPAGATSCKQWNRLNPGGKADTVAGMIQSVVYGNTAQKYNVPKPQIERCAMGKVDSIVLDIDDTCSDRKTGDKQAPRRTVNRYIKSCVSNRPR